MFRHYFLLAICFVSPLLEAAVRPSAGAGGQQQFKGTLLFFGVIFVLFYLFFLAPQRKQQRKHDNMLKELKPGDRVMTKGGIKGIVSAARQGEDFIFVKVADNVKIEVLRSSIEKVLQEKAPA